MREVHATVQEFDEALDALEPLAEDMRRRRPPLSEEEIQRKLAGIARLQFRVVGTCPRCDRPVRACDPRRSVGDDDDRQLFHLGCVIGAAPGRGRDGGREVTGDG
jgi:hypothetical protein